MKNIIFLLFLFPLISKADPASSQYIFQDTDDVRDTYIRSGAFAGNNYGIATTMVINTNSSISGLIAPEFDRMKAVIGDNMLIVACTLFCMLSNAPSSADTVGAYHIRVEKKDWQEGALNGTSGSGVQGATYSRYYYDAEGDVAWTAAGCQDVSSDRYADPVAKVYIPNTASAGDWFAFPLDTSLVNGWYNNVGENPYGVKLALFYGSSTLQFYSSDHATSGNHPYFSIWAQPKSELIMARMQKGQVKVRVRKGGIEIGVKP